MALQDDHVVLYHYTGAVAIEAICRGGFVNASRWQAAHLDGGSTVGISCTQLGPETHPDALYKNNWGDAWDPKLDTAEALAKTQFALELRVPREKAVDQTHLPEHNGRNLWVVWESAWEISAVFERSLSASTVTVRRRTYTPPSRRPSVYAAVAHLWCILRWLLEMLGLTRCTMKTRLPSGRSTTSRAPSPPHTNGR